MSKIDQINNVVASYFSNNKTVTLVPAKDLMPYFILAGIFPKDHKNGLPIRNILRALDSKNQLAKLPHVLAERKDSNTNWFFSSTPTTNPIIPKADKTLKNKIKTPKPTNSDEHYVIDLCDEILNQKAQRQHRFSFLVGDPNPKGTCSKLPVDAYYPELNIVIEFREKQHTQEVPFFDKPNLFTVSGVNRSEQRKRYDQKRRDILPQHGIKLIEIDFFQLTHNAKGKLLREQNNDYKAISTILKPYHE